MVQQGEKQSLRIKNKIKPVNSSETLQKRVGKTKTKTHEERGGEVLEEKRKISLPLFPLSKTNNNNKCYQDYGENQIK